MSIIRYIKKAFLGLLNFTFNIQIYSAQNVVYWVVEFWRYLFSCNWQFSKAEPSV